MSTTFTNGRTVSGTRINEALRSQLRTARQIYAAKQAATLKAKKK